jgi:hypothetical protein
VQASPLKQLDFARLKTELPEEWKKREFEPVVEVRETVQGGVPALETIVKTRRGKNHVIIIERRFSTAKRNYEVRLTCDSAVYWLRESDLRAMLDSFAEMPAEAQASET